MPQDTPRVINLDDYYDSPEQCCVELGWSTPSLYKRIRNGELETVLIGRTRLIKRKAA